MGLVALARDFPRGAEPFLRQAFPGLYAATGDESLPVCLRRASFRYGRIKYLPFVGSSTTAPLGIPLTSIKL